MLFFKMYFAICAEESIDLAVYLFCTCNFSAKFGTVVSFLNDSAIKTSLAPIFSCQHKVSLVGLK